MILADENVSQEIILTLRKIESKSILSKTATKLVTKQHVFKPTIKFFYKNILKTTFFKTIDFHKRNNK